MRTILGNTKQPVSATGLTLELEEAVRAFNAQVDAIQAAGQERKADIAERLAELEAAQRKLSELDAQIAAL